MSNEFEFVPDGHGGMVARPRRAFSDPSPGDDQAMRDPMNYARYGDPFTGGTVTPEELAKLHRQEEAEAAKLERVTIGSNEGNMGFGASMPVGEALRVGRQADDLEAAKKPSGELYAGKFKTGEELAAAYHKLVAELRAKGIEVD